MSIGVVCEDGREFYAVSTEFDPDRAGQWVRGECAAEAAVTGRRRPWRSRERIRDDLLKFLVPRPGVQPELWAWVGAYDHVVLVPAVGHR